MKKRGCSEFRDVLLKRESRIGHLSHFRYALINEAKEVSIEEEGFCPALSKLLRYMREQVADVYFPDPV